tara:strand:+ start:345 stop:701 length:357 start_codon:yes stop_codon:yes gene_type:complete
MDDSFYLGWLARECRFQASIHRAPRLKLGYKLHRKVIVSPKDEPKLNLWLATQGVHGRILKSKEQIELVMKILTPVRELVADKSGWVKMCVVLDEQNTRYLAYDDIIRISNLFEKASQ